MDNKRNSERDKILEEILNEVSSARLEGKQAKPADEKKGSAIKDKNTVKSPDITKNTKTNSNEKIDKTGKVREYTVKIKNPEQPTAREIIRNSIENEKGENQRANIPVNTETKSSSTSQRSRVLPKVSAEESYGQSSNANPEHPEKQIRKKTAPEKCLHKKRTQKRKRSARLPIVLMLTTLILTVSICLSILIIAIGRDMLAIGKDESLKMVTIPSGADTAEVASILEKEGIIEIPKAFEIVAGMSGEDSSFIPGQYELSPSYAYETIIKKLTTIPDENKETVDITFVEGISVYEAAQLLEEKKVCEAERFLYYFNAGGYGFDFEDKLPTSSPLKFYRMEGYLWPDTYKFYVDSDPESVCMKIYQNFENKITDEYYTQMQKKGMTLDEVITLASIVQAEAPDIKSMKKVASVFENRLSNPDEFPMLQSDPTTYYVEEIIKPNVQVPSTEIFDAYDTYKAHGLPPGAIGNPGQDAVEAVLFPADTDYYYFAADIDTKETFFAKTLEEHEENLASINGETDNNDDGEGEDEDYYE